TARPRHSCGDLADQEREAVHADADRRGCDRCLVALFVARAAAGLLREALPRVGRGHDGQRRPTVAKSRRYAAAARIHACPGDRPARAARRCGDDERRRTARRNFLPNRRLHARGRRYDRNRTSRAGARIERIMSMNHTLSRLAIGFAAMFLIGCATRSPVAAEEVRSSPPAANSVLRSVAFDPALEERILALDPEHVSDEDVTATLAKAPAPHIVLLHGGVWGTNLIIRSAGRFLVGMGYPESRIRNPGDRSWSVSPYEDSAQIAGLLAWYYEHEGVRPMMIGHSQGGIQAVKVLYELAGRYNSSVDGWDPYTTRAPPGTTIVDPLTGAERPVVGLELSYVSAVGAGGAALMLPNQWSMTGKVHTIPDSVIEFTGFVIGFDTVA